MNEEQQWQAIQDRDRRWDDQFVYGVMSTGIYCRPSCAARKPCRQDIRIYRTPAEAEQAGMRPCKRCHPEQRSTNEELRQRMHALCRYIEANVGQSLTLEHLGRQAHMSSYHLQRRFKSIVGVTPKQYAEGCRLRTFKQGLKSPGTVTDAIYDAGFGSVSRAYERVPTHMGMTPAQYQSGGRDMAISYATAPTPLGVLLMAATDRGLCFVELGDDEAEMLTRLVAEYPAAEVSRMPAGGSETFWVWMQALCDHLRDADLELDLPTDIRGTVFQMKVWNYLCRIPKGETRTYKAVAEAIGQPKAVRAVANVCAANRVALAIPCHRVIRGDGGLGGYRWGVERKRMLLERERKASAEAS